MKEKKSKTVIIVVVVLILLLFIAPFGVAAMIYEDNFGNRYEKYEPMARSIDEFEGLNSHRYTFTSDQGQILVGYGYYRELENNKGLVIMAHGLGGGGHNLYMAIADFFTSNGYAVFAYDATGNGESEGSSVKGLPQGIIDLDYAIQFVKQTPEFKGLPIMLFGHSWGAYSAGSVLSLQPDVKAIVMVAGFNKSMDIIEEEGRRIAGDGINFILPYISLYEKLKFGKYSSYTCIDGFENSDAGVMVIHSSDDEMISEEMSFDVFYDIYNDNPRFNFVKYHDKGHDYVFYSPNSHQYRDEFNLKFEEYLDSLDEEFTAEIKESYLNDHLDKKSLYVGWEQTSGNACDACILCFKWN